jgi:hypothetical protein
MAAIKSFEEFFSPDPTNEFFPFLSLEKRYEHALAYCQLHDRVPEDVRSYFNAVVTLWLYGWLYYPFHTLAHFLSSVVVEMALRQRFPAKKFNRKGRDPRTLRHLLIEAKEAGLLRDEQFPSLKNRRANAAEMYQQLAETLGRDLEPEPVVPYADALIECIPRIRNDFAHPEMHAILPPGPALDGPILAAEIINQLWPTTVSG